MSTRLLLVLPGLVGGLALGMLYGWLVDAPLVSADVVQLLTAYACGYITAIIASH